MEADTFLPSAAADAPKVSVAMITYNHEAFIGQAMDSVLMQETRFPVELVIGEDGSTDTTRKVVLDCQRRHPGRVRVLARDTNSGMIVNFNETLDACRGEYIAVLEGDDYWFSPHKLQRQIDFLDTHPEFVISCHHVKVEDTTAQNEVGWPRASFQHPVHSLEELLDENFIPTCSVVFRRSVYTALPAAFGKLKIADWPLWIFLARKGPIHYLHETMAVYRVHGNGVWTSMRHIEQLKALIRFFELLAEHLETRWGRLCQTRLSHLYCALAYQLALTHDAGATAAAWKLWLKAVRNIHHRGVPTSAKLGKLLLRLLLASVGIRPRRKPAH